MSLKFIFIGIGSIIIVGIILAVVLSKKHTCKSNCNNKVCGDNGCGGSCGSCTSPESCYNGQCVNCVPNCSGKECGDDGCGGSCGTCGSNFDCISNSCICANPCGNGTMQCGQDSCGNNCGTCGANQVCNSNICQNCPSDSKAVDNLCVCNDNTVNSTDCCYSGGSPKGPRGQHLTTPAQCCYGNHPLDSFPFWECN